MDELLLKEEVYAIIGAAIEVHRVLGAGFLEAVYQEAFELELAERLIPFQPQQELHIFYQERQLTKTYVADVFCYNQIVVELKALTRLSSVEDSQILNYLKTTQFRVGLLINFGSRELLEWKRFVN